MQGSIKGLAAGAAGTAALNVVTYLDMLIRGRPASEVPKKDAEKLAEMAGVELSSEGNDSDAAQARSTALGALLGYVTGLGLGAAYGMIRSSVDRVPTAVAGTALGLGAMAGSDIPSIALGMTDPRQWGAKGWAADVVPHLAYGFVTAAVYEALDR